ncbi:hypothetical protein F3Y22_tig00110387pilonHSYRG00198 [Hibiscus syriacus]|uniref:DUF674 family protein n=1 Tax=Hibiscus syriacus TaxID=106335 RepID=A0A6A3AVK2_HIBSY|nr:hypothetical protein F3Y22_tig00110387pilonHSYRG00198 [Hibiscus syriacus]
MATETLTISIKLFYRNRVVLAEAGKDFVDTLCGLLMFPVGKIARLVDKHLTSLLSCLKNGLRTDACKDMLLRPRSVHEEKFKTLKLSMDDATEPTKYFVCEKMVCRLKPVGWLSYYRTTRCTCGKLMNKEDVIRVERNVLKEETRGKSIFIITDDFRVMQGIPSSTPMSDDQFVLVTPDLEETTKYNGKERTENDGRTSVKIMLRKSDGKVLYAEAGANFVDLLFSFLTIPLELVLGLLGGKDNLTTDT